MTHVYLILFIDTESKRVVRAQIAGAFPVSQSDSVGIVQVCAREAIGVLFVDARRALVKVCFGQMGLWDWVRPIMSEGQQRELSTEISALGGATGGRTVLPGRTRNTGR